MAQISTQAVETTFDMSELAALTQALIDEGLSDATFAKVMGGNMARFLQGALPESRRPLAGQSAISPANTRSIIAWVPRASSSCQG